MNLFSAIDAHGWTIIIAAIGVVILQVMNLHYQKRGLVLSQKIHTLSNSNTAVLLLAAKVTTARLAALPDASEMDKEAAARASVAYDAHMASQDKVDYDAATGNAR